MRLATIPIALLLFLSPPISAQVGGGIETIFQATGPIYEDYYGWSVSDLGDIDGDSVPDFIVGAPSALTSFGGPAGTVYVYSGRTGAVIYSLTGGEAFGYSVSGGGDVTGDGIPDFLVGSPVYAGTTGRAYLYSGATGTIATYYAGQGVENFGYSVSIVEDTDGDGLSDVVIGAPWDFPAYVELYTSAGLSHHWVSSMPISAFGSSISGIPDIDNDGFGDVIVGDHTINGSVRIYSGATGSVIHQFYGTIGVEKLGWCVDDCGDVDGDGIHDIAIGAIAPSGSTVNNMYVRSGATGAVLYQYQTNNNVPAIGGIGDWNGDGHDDFAIADVQGRVSLYSGASGSLLGTVYGGGAFGRDISSAGDLTGNGRDELLVGAGWFASAAAYVFSNMPYLSADTNTVSASVGGVINLTLDFPNSAGYEDYKVLISATGIGPTTYGVEIPLTQDFLVRSTFFGNYPFPTYSNLHGSLDPSGDASASVSVSPGLPSSLVGRTFWLAAIANQFMQLPNYSSVVVPIEITL